MSSGVAVVGMSGRFPGARDVDSFWENIRQGVESIAQFSAAELAASGVARSILDNPRFVNAAGALEGIESFDAGLFGYNPREAETIDPQHRVFLECAWESLEHAGYNPFGYDGLIGVYAGTGTSTYLERVKSDPALAALLGHFQLSIGNEKDHLTTRVAYKLDLHGPAVTIQTTCSSSLVAVVLACQGLLTRQCDVALAGGVSIVVPQRTGYLYTEGSILSPDGHCRAFDVNACGAVGGNGCGVVVLRRLDDALADGDHVHAVIVGMAINNDGSRKVGYTAPSVDGQAEVITRAQAMAGVSPDQIGYVEAHGTGTPLGDPIEVAALTEAFRKGTERRGYCALGSVKTNVGHLDAAAGVTGLIKAILAVQHGQIPPTLHFREANPALNLATSPFFVNQKLRDWPGAARRAGVSSFGIGGTNAHVVIEQASSLSPPGTGREHQLIVLSGRTSTALDNVTENLARHLAANPELELADVAHTLQSGRVALAHRRALIATNRAEAAAALVSRPISDSRTGSSPTVAFLFPGQGAQHLNMAAQVYTAEPIFRAQLDRAAQLLRDPLDLDIRQILFPTADETSRAQGLLRQTAVAQPALFAVEYALAQLWIQWGVRPDALIGHSVGEYVAACVSGTVSLEDSLALVAERARLMQEMPPGAMLALPIGETAVRPLLGDELSVAAINGMTRCVVSGPEPAIQALEQLAAERGLAGSRLNTSHAFHSAMMEPILEAFAERLRAIQRYEPVVPWVSNLHGGWIDKAEATDPSYWTAHLRSAIRFSDGIGTLLEDPDRILLEVGPGQTLTRLARSHPTAKGRTVLASLPDSLDRVDDERYLLTALGRLFVAGVDIDWTGFQGRARHRRVPLPTYPFERQRYWIEEKPRRAPILVPASSSLSKSNSPEDWVWVPTWRRTAPTIPHDTPQGPWLVLDDGKLGADVAGRLEERHQQVMRVRPGAGFNRVSQRAFILDPEVSSYYRQLIETLQAEGQMPARIVDLWSLRGGARKSFYSLLFLAQAFIDAGRTDPLEIVVVSCGLYDVTGNEPLDPDGALVLGPCKVIPQERSHIRCRSIDLAISDDAAALVAELTSGSNEPTVAYRGGHRWVQGFDKLGLTTTQAPVLRVGGTYLITGGLGDVGLALAEAIARSARANLVLVGRSEIPAAGDWTTHIAADGHRDPTSRKLSRMQELERLGARVRPARADVSNATQLRAVIDQVHAEFGPLHGVIHAAGATEADAFGPVEEMTVAACERHFKPKVDGLRALDITLTDESLDFCVLVSSLSALLGGLGFVAYAGANAYMDSFATARAREGKRWMSINWDGWDFSSKPREGRLALTREEGLGLFPRLISLSAAAFPAQVAISTGDLNTRIDQWVRLTSLRVDTAATSPAPAGTVHERPLLASSYEAPSNDVERFVAEVWQALLGIHRIGRHDNFFELGGDSLLAIRAASRLRDTYRVEISVHALFEAPTVAGLAAEISQALTATIPNGELAEILDQVESLSDDEIAALLAESPEQPPSAPRERLLTHDLMRDVNGARATEGSAKPAIQRFYDAVSSQLNTGDAREYSFFLNYGYVADGRNEHAVHQLPSKALNRNGIQLVLEVIGNCELDGRRVLDVGCGRGGTIEVLHRFFSPGETVGLDLSPVAIDFCRRTHRYPQVSFLCGDAERLPFPAGSFDAVVNIESSHSYPDIDAFYAEVSRVLKPGGVFLYSDTMPASKAASRLDRLTAHGFRTELARDITSNVVRSCDELAGIHAQAFDAGNAPEVLGEFLAVPGSQNYDNLRSRRLVYGIWRLRRI